MSDQPNERWPFKIFGAQWVVISDESERAHGDSYLAQVLRPHPTKLLSLCPSRTQ